VEEDDKKLEDLKSIYDELWLDAKTLVKDMRKSVYIYLYAGLVTLVVAIASVIGVLPFYLTLLINNGNLLTWAFVIFEIVATVIVISFGIQFLFWFKTLKRRYSRLIEMEKNWRKSDA
jgi:hypothetical protein